MCSLATESSFSIGQVLGAKVHSTDWTKKLSIRFLKYFIASKCSPQLVKETFLEDVLSELKRMHCN